MNCSVARLAEVPAHWSFPLHIGTAFDLQLHCLHLSSWKELGCHEPPVCMCVSVLHIETKHLNIISKKPAPTPGHIHPFPVPPTRSQTLPPSLLFLSCPDLSVWFLFGSLCEPIRHRGAAQIELSSRRYMCNPLFQPNPATSALKANGLPFTSMGFDHILSDQTAPLSPGHVLPGVPVGGTRSESIILTAMQA